jgi:hypothetical protein
MSLLVADGFVQDRLGQLQWDGAHDGLILLALLIGCAVSADVRSELIEASRRRRARPSGRAGSRIDPGR